MKNEGERGNLKYKRTDENQKVYPPQVPHFPFCYTGQVVMSFPPYTGVPHYCQVTQPAVGIIPIALLSSSSFSSCCCTWGIQVVLCPRIYLDIL